MSGPYEVVELEDGTFCASCLGVRIRANPGVPTDREYWQKACDMFNSLGGDDEVVRAIRNPSASNEGPVGLAPCVLPDGTIDPRIAPALSAIKASLAAK